MDKEQFLYDCFVVLPELFEQLSYLSRIDMENGIQQFAKDHHLDSRMVLNSMKGLCSWSNLYRYTRNIYDDLPEDTIILPDGMKRFRRKAFIGNDDIITIKIPASIEIIDAGVFSFCSHLQEVQFPKDSQLRRIEKEAFENSSSLHSINIPESAFIREDVFNNTVYLEKLCSGEILCPANVFLSLNSYEQFYICSNRIEEQCDEIKQILMKNLEDIIDFHTFEGNTERLKHIIRYAGNPQNIKNIIKIIIRETEQTKNYELRVEILEYQKKLNLYPDNHLFL